MLKKKKFNPKAKKRRKQLKSTPLNGLQYFLFNLNDFENDRVSYYRYSRLQARTWMDPFICGSFKLPIDSLEATEAASYFGYLKHTLRNTVCMWLDRDHLCLLSWLYVLIKAI